jgi:histidinol-phosphate phosphatase family protein
MEGQVAVFLDRDGTINEDKGYIGRPEDIELIEGAGEAIRLINGNGLKAVVVSNQSGVGRGYFSNKDLELVNARLKDLLQGQGAFVDAIYACPHRPEDSCRCRKPMTGLVERAVKELSLDANGSYVVGDKTSDMGLARNIGAKAVLVLTGMGKDAQKDPVDKPDFIAEDLLHAVHWILKDADPAR